MIKKIKSLIQSNKLAHKTNLLQLKELEWANIYHDSIRGKDWLEKTSLNIGRWAGNYSFFYVLNRILYDYQPKKIIEFGLGESSKFISKYLENYLSESNHLIIEHDNIWFQLFSKKFKLSARSNVEILPLYKNVIQGLEINSYRDIDKKSTQSFDLYVIDGPFGSQNYSRYDIVVLLENINKDDEFIIILDDYHRKGEQQTAEEIFKLLKNKEITYFKEKYTGNKEVLVIGTKKYKFINSL